MGHRCTLVIKEQNKVELFYGHWTGVELPDQLFWGPEYVEAYIRGHEAVDFWMKDLFADGCVGLDKDQKILFVHRGTGKLSKGEKSKYFYVLMGALWQEEGWRVEQVKEMEEIAVHMGYRAEEARWVPDPSEPWPLNTIPETLSANFLSTLIVTPNARFGAMPPWNELLANGPELLAHLARFPQFDESMKAETTVSIDPISKEITVHWYHPYCERYFPHMKEVWPGWTFHFTQPDWALEDDEDDDEDEDEFAHLDPTDFRKRVYMVLLSQPHNSGPDFMKVLSKMGATVAPGAETGPPENELTLERRAEILASTLKIVVQKGLDS